MVNSIGVIITVVLSFVHFRLPLLIAVWCKSAVSFFVVAKEWLAVRRAHRNKQECETRVDNYSQRYCVINTVVLSLSAFFLHSWLWFA